MSKKLSFIGCGLSLIHIQMCIRDRAGFAKENMDSALQKKTQFENDNDMDKLLAPNECPYTLDELNEMISKVEGSLDEIRASLVQYGRQMDDLQEPVSYTHLDVYKRQCVYILLRKFLSLFRHFLRIGYWQDVCCEVLQACLLYTQMCIRDSPCGDIALNKLGLSTQVPVVLSYISDGPVSYTHLLGMIGMGYGIAKRNKTNKEGDAR